MHIWKSDCAIVIAKTHEAQHSWLQLELFFLLVLFSSNPIPCHILACSQGEIRQPLGSKLLSYFKYSLLTPLGRLPNCLWVFAIQSFWWHMFKERKGRERGFQNRGQDQVSVTAGGSVPTYVVTYSFLSMNHHPDTSLSAPAQVITPLAEVITFCHLLPFGGQLVLALGSEVWESLS